MSDGYSTARVVAMPAPLSCEEKYVSVTLRKSNTPSRYSAELGERTFVLETSSNS